MPCYADEDLGTDTILQGQQLRDGQYLDSASQIFRLKFFSPVRSASKNRYLHIVYIDVDGRQMDSIDGTVWVANRNDPIPDVSGMLMFDSNDGMLKISCSGGKSVVLSTSTTVGSRNKSATLLDDGNFVLREMNPDGSINRSILWQSFDYPTHKLLPGMKLGINFMTGHKWSLTSWANDEVPASGSFTLGGDPNGTNQLIMWWQESVYWTSGLWHNGRFENTPDLALYSYINFSYIANQNEKYLTYSVKGSNKRVTFSFGRYGIFRRIEEKGVLSDCFESKAGCVQQKLPECRKGDFQYQIIEKELYGESYRFDENYNMNFDDCNEKCMLNCSCVAFASIRRDGTGCEIWSKDKLFSISQRTGNRNIFIVLARTERARRKWWIWLIAAVSGTLLAVVVCYSLRRNLRVKRKRKEAKKEKLGKLVETITRPGKYKTANNKIVKKLGFWCYSLQRNLRLTRKRKEVENVQLGELVDTITRPGKYYRAIDQIEKQMSQVQLFSFASIEMATNNFSAANKLGEGGFGPVYKGELPGGQEIAIKRLSRSSGQGLLEFKNEILLIAKLHKYSRLRVIHRDLKASNILLDQNMNPKISDFGMARIFGKQESETNTKRIVGTHGYMSPEYAIKGIVSAKTDVFSFGVLLLEIVSGRKYHGCYHSQRPLNLIGLAWELWIEGRDLELMDTTILEDSNQKNKVKRCINVGLLCVQDDAADRPLMMDVVTMLSNEFLQLPTPKQPAFFIKTNTPEVEIEVALQKNCTNVLSVSVMAAR